MAHFEDVLSDLNVTEQAVLDAWLRCAYFKSRTYGDPNVAGEMTELIHDLRRAAPV